MGRRMQMNPTIPLDRAILKCLSLTSHREYGYEPYVPIVRGQKTHTLRTRRKASGIYECSFDGERGGVVVEIGECEEIHKSAFLTDDFAVADGVVGCQCSSFQCPWHAPAKCLRKLLMETYDEVPEIMVLVHFELVYWKAPNGEWYDQPPPVGGYE